MHELALMIAKVLPFESLVEEMEKGLAEYRLDPTPDKKEKFVFMCTMIAMNKATEGKDITEMMKEANHVTRVMDQFKSVS